MLHMKKNAEKDTFRRFRFISPLNMHSTTGIRLPLLFSMSLEEIFWLHYTKKGASEEKQKKNVYREKLVRLLSGWLAIGSRMLPFAHGNSPFVDLFCQQF